jgi:hypothetical protein
MTAKWAPSLFVDLGSKGIAKNFIKEVADSNSDLSINGHSIGIKSARTKFNSSRNYSMRSALDLIKSHPTTGTKVVEFKWDERTVTVDNIAVFSQAKGDIGGKFLPPYSDLSLE